MSVSDLFPDAPRFDPPERPKREPPAPRARLVVEADWTVEDHLCSACFGRILSRQDSPTSTRVFRCSNCGATGEGWARTEGLTHPPICTCARRIAGRDAGIRCIVNDNRTPDVPGEVISREVR